MPIIPILKSNCPPQRAGISRIYSTESENIASLTFNADQEVTGITMNGGATFSVIEFEKNTAFFNQTKTRNGQALNVAQLIQFVLAGMDVARRLAVYELNKACSMVNIVKLNTGKLVLAGISYFPDESTFEFEDMQTGDGSWFSGDNPNSASNETIESMAANTNFYSPFLGIAEASIPV